MSAKKQTSTNLEKAIEKMSIGGHNQFADCFSNFLDLALSYFCNNMDERQMELRAKVGADIAFRESYTEALKCFGDDAEGYHDPLGDIFMSRISHGDHGQFFTPESISLLMSEIIMGDKLHDGMTVNDPACGTGRTLLMALKHIRSKGFEPNLYANDLSMTCAKMALLNFCINSVDGAVTCGDALLNDPKQTTFFKLDKLRNLTTDAVLTTYWQYTLSDVEKVQEKREKWWLWVAERGWVKYFKLPKAPDSIIDGGVIGGDKFECQITKQGAQLIKEKQQIDPLQTEIKMGEQLSLFD